MARVGKRRISSVVALTLLEVIRSQDLPAEILQDEDPTITMPRRLGLSDVIDRQIRRYREEVRRRRRITEQEMQDLFRLVVRRPDAADVFFLVGERLSERIGGGGRFERALPGRLGHALARRRVRKGLRSLFGRSVGSFSSRPFVLEGRALLFVQNAPEGDACSLVSGFCQSVLERYVGDAVLVVHDACEARGNAVCRWRAHDVPEGEPAGAAPGEGTRSAVP